MAEENPTPEVKPEDNKQDSDALNKLTETLDSFGSRLDDFSTKIEEIDSKTDPNNIAKSIFKTQETDEGGFVPKDWVPSTDKGWNDVFAKAAEIADTKAGEKLEKYLTEQKQIQDQSKAEEARIDQYLDTQIDQLVKDGKIPAIKDEADPNDPGRVARKELYNLGVEYESTNLAKMADLRDKLNGKSPAGADAPVGSSTKTTTSNNKSTPDYKYIHESSMDKMIRDEMNS